ncbi:TIGR03086 family metal-binding protein [Haloactinomyces albus]|uniref:Uncharacterized protein (TIGR03086 family) n=1 Tax=Haloactinomyces albus TaxID=1352928 RepID=A0AAE3ZIN7_9ACTN|nr:TIGR03086 family metal-binding protein [Haloactinomyces albus]MDR7304298.1 uncharacterized protein (TIGR03086 family) [Haloactinomyces albus]
MNEEHTRVPLLDGVGLLERAITYTLGSLHLVTQADLLCSTPCRDWDLRALLRHMEESLVALHEAVDTGHVGIEALAEDGDPAVDPVTALRNRACRLLGASTGAGSRDVVSIADAELTTGIVTSTGALEIAVHGWDIARARRDHRPIPEPLAEEMLALLPLFVTDADRPGRFAAPVDVPPWAGPGDRLLAFLGRDP